MVLVHEGEGPTTRVKEGLKYVTATFGFLIRFCQKEERDDEKKLTFWNVYETKINK